jgi:hypothetical protein
MRSGGSAHSSKGATVTDAPERTYVLICGPEGPLSERLRWVNG